MLAGPQTVNRMGIEWRVTSEPPIPERPPTPPGVEYFSGLDLGQCSDPTALAVLERTMGEDPAGKSPHPVAHYALRSLRRWPVGTSYVDIVADVEKLFAEAPLKNTYLAVDRTGVGRPVVEMLQKAKVRARLHPIMITSGHGSRPDTGGAYNVAKIELVGSLQVILQIRRLKVAQSLPECTILIKELQNFRVKITAAQNEIFEAWRDGQNDDLVLAVACAAWLAERGRRVNIT